MPRFRSMATACAIGFAAISGAAVLSATDAGAALITTKISLADFKSEFNLAGLRRFITNSNVPGVSFYSQRFNTDGKSFRKFGGKLDLSKSFFFFRVDTNVVTGPFNGFFRFKVKPGPFRENKPLTVLEFAFSGNATSGVTSVTLEGLSVSPS